MTKVMNPFKSVITILKDEIIKNSIWSEDLKFKEEAIIGVSIKDLEGTIVMDFVFDDDNIMWSSMLNFNGGKNPTFAVKISNLKSTFTRKKRDNEEDDNTWLIIFTLGKHSYLFEDVANSLTPIIFIDEEIEIILKEYIIDEKTEWY